MEQELTPADRWTRGERAGLLALLVFTVMALGGYWAFALHPQWLPQDPWALGIYTISFRAFAQLQIAFAAVALAIPLINRLGTRWILGFVAIYLLSFLSEFTGTGYGIPFGGYHYTSLLGPKLGGRVPFLIPLSWFFMAVPAYVIAWTAAPSVPRWARLALASALLVIWDLALDPAMSYLTTYWIWDETGPFYGMPWMNLFGWFVTGYVLMAVLEGTGGRGWAEALGSRFAVVYYALVLLMPLGMVLAAGLWLSVFVTLAALGAWWMLSRALERRAESGEAPEGTTSLEGSAASPAPSSATA